MQFLPLYNSKTITLTIGVLSSYYGQFSIRFMSEEQYKELLKAYTKEALASMIKADIRSRFPELMPACIASSLIISRTLQISFNLQQKLRGYNIGL